MILARCFLSRVSRQNPKIYFSTFQHTGGSGQRTNRGAKLVGPESVEKLCGEIGSINARLENMQLTASFLSGNLDIKKEIHLPENYKSKIEAPTSTTITSKTFIVETPAEILNPENGSKKIEDPLKNRIKKHAVRMIVLRRKKMKKHKLKKLRKRMYLKFRAVRVRREKKKELAFRYKLMEKISEARKFDVEKYVAEYLKDYHTPLLPLTYKGKRLPEWLIKELIEQDIQNEQDKKMEGKSFTTKEQLIQPGETVEQFTKRVWGK